jgi:hypothetical protein
MIFDWGMVVFFGLCVDVLGLYLIEVLRKRYSQPPLVRWPAIQWVTACWPRQPGKRKVHRALYDILAGGTAMLWEAFEVVLSFGNSQTIGICDKCAE